MKWISINNELPRPGLRVIFATEGGFVGEGYRAYQNQWSRYDKLESVEQLFSPVTHWMRFPEPPEGVE